MLYSHPCFTPYPSRQQHLCALLPVTRFHVTLPKKGLNIKNIRLRVPVLTQKHVQLDDQLPIYGSSHDCVALLPSLVLYTDIKDVLKGLELLKLQKGLDIRLLMWLCTECQYLRTYLLLVALSMRIYALRASMDHPASRPVSNANKKTFYCQACILFVKNSARNIDCSILSAL
jgi:hypothetical protein